MIPDLKCKVVHTEEYKGITLHVIHNPAYAYYGLPGLQYNVQLWRPGTGLKTGEMVCCRGDQHKGEVITCLYAARKAIDNDEYN